MFISSSFNSLIAAGISNTHGDVATIRGLEGLFANVIAAVLGLGSIVLFIMLIAGGFSYITAGGDPQKAAQARTTLTYAIGGMILMAAALLIIRLIETITGVNVSLDVFQIYR